MYKLKQFQQIVQQSQAQISTMSKLIAFEASRIAGHIKEAL